MIASLISILTGYLNYNYWQLFFLIGGIGSLPLMFLRSKIPESPRWLI